MTPARGLPPIPEDQLQVFLTTFVETFPGPGADRLKAAVTNGKLTIKEAHDIMIEALHHNLVDNHVNQTLNDKDIS